MAAALALLMFGPSASAEEAQPPLERGPLPDRLGLFPTAHSIPKETFLISDYDLAVVQFGLGVTDALQLSAQVIVPIESATFGAALNAKYRYLGLPQLDLALFQTVAFATNSGLSLVATGHAATACADSTCRLLLNVTAALLLRDLSGNWGGAVAIGAAVRVVPHVKVIAEVSAGAYALGDMMDRRGRNLLTYGLRFFGTSWSLDLLFSKLVRVSGGIGFDGRDDLVIGQPMFAFTYHSGAAIW